MKTDKELLILAAKAANVYAVPVSPFDGLYITGKGVWNPLADDAKALRLAVDFEFDIAPMGYYVAVTDISGHVTEQEYGNDKHAATRRAIVRAAAAIGEDME